MSAREGNPYLSGWVRGAESVVYDLLDMMHYAVCVCELHLPLDQERNYNKHACYSKPRARLSYGTPYICFIAKSSWRSYCFTLFLGENERFCAVVFLIKKGATI